MKPGDLALVRSKGALPGLIRLGERIRHRGPACRWNHVALVTDATGATIEAEARGVIRLSLAAHPDHLVIDSGLTDAERARVLAFANSCVGDHYGYLTVASIALDLLSPDALSFKSARTLICSELAARALEHGGWVCPELDTSRVMPSDLATWLTPAA